MYSTKLDYWSDSDVIDADKLSPERLQQYVGISCNTKGLLLVIESI
jgi:hypothetical protein